MAGFPDMPARMEAQAGSTLPRRRRSEGSPHERAERLTGRELEILQLTADGLGPDAISRQLGISRHTLRTHVQNAMTKLGVHSKLEAITFAIRTGKIQLEAFPENGDGR